MCGASRNGEVRMPVRILSTTQPDFARRFATLRHYGGDATAAVDTQARQIVEAVRQRGDRALVDFTRRYDRVTLRPAQLRVSAEEIHDAIRAVSPGALRALRLAARRIAAFHGVRCRAVGAIATRRACNSASR